MRPVRLRVRGFTAFREETEVEFEGRRLFVITGPTGAGKSSLLDAMTWALYGRVARSRNNEELVSQGEREMSVLLEFTVRGRGYRVSRRYPGSTTTRLERLVQEQWVPIADKAAEVKREVESILGMDYATFTRAIVLPQGEFDSFLRGDAKDRRSILSQLIGLGIYQRAGEIARDRAKGHRTQAETIRTQLEKLPLATPEVITQLRERERQLAAEAESLTKRRGRLQALGDLARAEHERREAAAQAASNLREAEDELAEARRILREADGAVESCRTAVERTSAELAALRYDPAEHDRLKAAVARLDQRAEAERTLATARAELAGAQKAAADAGAAREQANTQADEAATAHQAAVRAARAAEAALAKAAGRAGRLVVAVATAVEVAEAAATDADTAARRLAERLRELRSLQQALASADVDRARARDAALRAERDHETRVQETDQATEVRARADQQVVEARAALDRARAEDAAAHLRAGLKVGEPCPVCGEPIAKLGKHAAPRLARAGAALERAEAAQRDARAGAEAAVAAMAAAVARLDECGRAREATEAHHASIVTQLDAHEVSADALLRSIEETQHEAARHAEMVETRRAEAAEGTRLGQSLRESLARVPSSITPTEVKRVPADADATREELTGAVAAHGAAQEAMRAAEQTATNASAAEEAAHRATEVAARDVERSERGVTQAERQVASLGAVEGAEGDPAAVRAALAAAEQRAARQGELTAALATQREALASAEASRAGAATAREKLETTAARRREELAVAEQGAGAAHRELVASWRQTIGEGEPSIRGLKSVMEAFEAERDRVQEALVTARNSAAQAEQQVLQAEGMRTDADRHQADADLVGAVGTDLQGNRFIAYLLHESMQLLAADASARLTTFTNGRYALVAEEDTFHVMDHLNGDELRSVKTLSGGETFLASLALALALSEHLPEISGTGGAVSLDSLFLDEGFGALDSEALDLAVQGLETLAEGSRMIGVISHVEELSERLPDRIRIEKGSHGSHVQR